MKSFSFLTGKVKILLKNNNKRNESENFKDYTNSLSAFTGKNSIYPSIVLPSMMPSSLIDASFIFHNSLLTIEKKND